MYHFFRFFILVLAVQAIIVGFVVMSGVGDWLLYYLYILPWLILRPHHPNEKVAVSIILLSLVPAAVYAALFGLIGYLVNKVKLS